MGGDKWGETAFDSAGGVLAAVLLIVPLVMGAAVGFVLLRAAYFYALWWALQHIGAPEPIAWIAIALSALTVASQGQTKET